MWNRITSFLILFLAVLFCHDISVAVQTESLSSSTCESTERNDGTCRTSSKSSSSSSSSSYFCSRNDDMSVCQSSRSLYDYSTSGSAQAYKPNAPIKSTVCASPSTSRSYHYHKVASWPLFRRTRRGPPPPTLQVEARVWSCVPNNNNNECCCQAWTSASSNSTTTQVEVWQARPDGTYSALTPGREEGDCRATLVRSKKDGNAFHFTTLAPGSTGGFGGLGPSKVDLLPYGPPVLHMLVTDPHHEPLLVQIPVLMDHYSLEQRTFWGSGVRSRDGQQAYRTSSWTTNASERTVQLTLDLFLTRASSDEEESLKTLESRMCPSFLYGLPSSFYTEPIAVCAPLLLNYFPL